MRADCMRNGRVFPGGRGHARHGVGGNLGVEIFDFPDHFRDRTEGDIAPTWKDLQLSLRRELGAVLSVVDRRQPIRVAMNLEQGLCPLAENLLRIRHVGVEDRLGVVTIKGEQVDGAEGRREASEDPEAGALEAVHNLVNERIT